MPKPRTCWAICKLKKVYLTASAGWSRRCARRIRKQPRKWSEIVMPLSNEEREFLDAYVFEATHDPFGGPATEDLNRRGVHYGDLHWLLTAYDRELCAQRILPFGQENPNPPPSPWVDLEHAKVR